MTALRLAMPLCVLLLGCAPSPAPVVGSSPASGSAQPNAATPSPELLRRLATAEAARDRANELEPPNPPKRPLSSADGKRFTREQVGSWIRRRRTAIDLAESAYELAADIAPEGLLPDIYLEMARMEVGLLDGFLASGKAGMPDWMLEDRTIKSDFMSSLMSSMTPLADKARKLLKLCVDLGQKSKQGKAVERCRRLCTEIDEIFPRIESKP